MSEHPHNARSELADLLLHGATTNAQKAHRLGDEAGDAEGDFRSMHARHHAQAALALTQAYLTATKVRSER